MVVGQFGQLLQILPMLVFFFLTFGSFGGSQQPQPLFSLQRNENYRFPMATTMQQHVMPGTQYFASHELYDKSRDGRLKDFEKLKIEKEVHNQYSNVLQNECNKEKRRNQRSLGANAINQCKKRDEFQTKFNVWMKKKNDDDF